jgi:hypothetical protein
MPETVRLFSATLAALAVASLPALSADDIKPPTSFRNWFHVNTMIIDKASPLFNDLGGMHNVYINATGLPALKKGGPYPTRACSSPTCVTSPCPTAPTSKARARASP